MLRIDRPECNHQAQLSGENFILGLYNAKNGDALQNLPEFAVLS